MTDSKSACACACHGMSLGLDGWQDCSLCCAKPAPAPPEERCRRCGEAPDAPIHQPAVMRESGCCEYYSPAPTPPAARKAALTRDLVVRMVNAAMFGWPDTNEPAKLLAHDAALRARAEALERDLAETGKESARYFDAYNDEVTRCQAFEARASRLEGLLREAMPSHGATCLGACMDENDGYEPFRPSPNCYTVQLIERIRKALAGEE